MFVFIIADFFGYVTGSMGEGKIVAAMLENRNGELKLEIERRKLGVHGAALVNLGWNIRCWIGFVVCQDLVPRRWLVDLINGLFFLICGGGLSPGG